MASVDRASCCSSPWILVCGTCLDCVLLLASRHTLHATRHQTWMTSSARAGQSRRASARSSAGAALAWQNTVCPGEVTQMSITRDPCMQTFGCNATRAAAEQLWGDIQQCTAVSGREQVSAAVGSSSPALYGRHEVSRAFVLSHSALRTHDYCNIGVLQNPHVGCLVQASVSGDRQAAGSLRRGVLCDHHRHAGCRQSVSADHVGRRWVEGEPCEPVHVALDGRRQVQRPIHMLLFLRWPALWQRGILAVQ